MAGGSQVHTLSFPHQQPGQLRLQALTAPRPSPPRLLLCPLAGAQAELITLTLAAPTSLPSLTAAHRPHRFRTAFALEALACPPPPQARFGGDGLLSSLLVLLPVAGDLPRGAGGGGPGPRVLPESEWVFFLLCPHRAPRPREAAAWGRGAAGLGGQGSDGRRRPDSSAPLGPASCLGSGNARLHPRAVGGPPPCQSG